MKVLFYTNNFGFTTTTFIRNEVDYLLEHTTFRYLCQDITGPYADKQFLFAIPFRENSLMQKIRWLLWKWDWACSFYSPSYSEKVKAFLKEYSPDIIHCHFGYEALMLLDNIDYGNYKVIIHFHGYDASQMIRKKSYIRKLKRVLSKDNVYAISCNDFFVHSLTKTLGIPASKFMVLRCGVDLNTFASSLITDGHQGKVFLQVSSLAEKKGHEITIRAFARFLKATDLKDSILIFTGDGSRRPALENLTKELGIEGNIRFVGNVNPTEVANLMAHADVFLHHSITPANGDMEGIPTAIMEAMAMELPVVSTYHSGIPELVEDGVNGFLVKERDVETYAQKMAGALLLGRLPVNRRKIEMYYNKEKHNEQLVSFYEEILP